jgi:hypothetical protein
MMLIIVTACIHIAPNESLKNDHKWQMKNGGGRARGPF